MRQTNHHLHARNDFSGGVFAGRRCCCPGAAAKWKIRPLSSRPFHAFTLCDGWQLAKGDTIFPTRRWPRMLVILKSVSPLPWASASGRGYTIRRGGVPFPATRKTVRRSSATAGADQPICRVCARALANLPAACAQCRRRVPRTPPALSDCGSRADTPGLCKATAFRPRAASFSVWKSFHTMEEALYYQTDHHWTMRGAYYGYAALMEGLGREPLPLSPPLALRSWRMNLGAACIPKRRSALPRTTKCPITRPRPPRAADL